MNLTLLIRDLGYAGAQRQLVALACGAHRAGHRVTVVSFYGGPLQAELAAAGVTVIGLEKRHRWDMVGFLVRLVKAILSSRPDVLYSFLNEANLLSALLRPLLPRTQIIWGLRDSETDAALYGWVGRAVFAASKFLSRWPDLLIANSHSGARYYAAQGYPPDNLRVVPNGIDLERFYPNPQARARVRAEQGIADNEILFGIVGRLSPMKDHATFLRAAAQVQGRVRFIAIGGGNDAYAEEMKALANELGLASRLIWSAPRSDMPAVFNALDLLVSSSAYGEGFSNVVGEAMACGTPCIVTDVGDSALLVGDTGLSVPPRDPAALAKAMQQMLAQRPTASPRTRIEAEFTVLRMVENTLHLMNADLAVAAEQAKTSNPPLISDPINPQSAIRNPKSRVRPVFLITALGSGGAEMMLTQLVTSLDREQFAPEVITLIPGGKHTATLEAAGIPVHDLGMIAGKPTLASLWKLRSLVKDLSPDLLVGWMYHGNLAATLASWIGHRASVLWNVRQSLYSLAYEKRGSALVIQLLARLGFSPRQIFYNSQLSARQHEAIGYPAAKTVLIPNGFNTEAFKPDPAARASVREELGLPADAILIGRFGRNSAMKDFPSFIQAMRQVPNAHAIIAGTGTEALAASLPSSFAIPHSSFHMLGERHDLPRLTAALDIACSSSAFGEGFPNVVAEAMSAAIPCVVTDVGDSAWLLQTAGRIVPPNDAAALASALAELVAMHPSQRHSLGQQGRQRITDGFSLPSVVRQFEAHLLAGVNACPQAATDAATTPGAPARNLNSKIPCAA